MTIIAESDHVPATLGNLKARIRRSKYPLATMDIGERFEVDRVPHIPDYVRLAGKRLGRSFYTEPAIDGDGNDVWHVFRLNDDGTSPWGI